MASSAAFRAASGLTGSFLGSLLRGLFGRLAGFAKALVFRCLPLYLLGLFRLCRLAFILGALCCRSPRVLLLHFRELSSNLVVARATCRRRRQPPYDGRLKLAVGAGQPVLDPIAYSEFGGRPWRVRIL